MKGKAKDPPSAEEGPDGGWGWVVAAGSLLNVALVIGVARCSGLLYATLPSHFGIGRSTAASLAAVNGVVLCLVGPISGALLKRFSCRQITIISGFICCGGIMVASFASSPIMFLVGFGLIAGTGSGLYLVPSKMIITQYFTKKRPLVLGLTISGSCLGGITIPPLMEWLTEKYNLEGALLIIAAIMLHFIPCGMTYIPLKETKKRTKMAANVSKSVETISSVVSKETELEVSANDVLPPPLNMTSLSDSGQKTLKTLDEGQWKVATEQFQRRSILADAITTVRKPSMKLQLAKSVIKGLKAANLSVFVKGHFLLIALSACCPLLGFTAISLTIPEYAREELDEPVSMIRAAFLLSLLSVGDLIGRVTMSGLISTRVFRIKYGFIATCVFSAAWLACFPFVNTYNWLAALTVIYGCFTGAANIMPVLLINDYLPQPDLASAYGYLLLILAFPIMAVAPLMGQVRDATGGYVISYWIVSGAVMAGTFPWVAEMVLECRTKQKTFWMEPANLPSKQRDSHEI